MSDLSKPNAYAPGTVGALANERGFKGAVRRAMAIVGQIEDTGFVDAPDLYEKWRTDMRRFLGCADLRPFYGSTGRWSTDSREWFAKNLLEMGKRMEPFNPRAVEAASEAAIVALELLTRWEASEGPAWMAARIAEEKEARALAKAQAERAAAEAAE